MKMTEQIQHAIQFYLLQNETVEEMAERIGVSFSTVLRWRNGEVEEIRTNHWKELFPLIEKYLNEQEASELIVIINHIESELEELKKKVQK